MLIARAVLFDVARTFLGVLTATTGMAFFMISLTFLKQQPGIGLGLLIELFPLFFPMALQFTVPVSALVAVVMVFGRLQSSGELTALSASGVNLIVIVWPVLAGAAIVATASLFLIDVATPYAGAKLREATKNLAEEMQTSFRSGRRDLPLGKARLSFEGYDRGEFQDVLVEVKQGSGKSRLLRARGGSIQVTKDDKVAFALDSLHAIIPREEGRGRTFASAELISGGIVLDESILDGGGRRKRGGLRAWELAHVWKRDIGKSYQARIRSPGAAEELARRSAFAGSVFFFVLVGITTGIVSARRTRVAAVIVGMAPIIVTYFPMVIAGSNLARQGTLPAYPAIWAGNAVLAIVGSILLYRVVRR